ncbi:MAG TPA: Na+/H+ antiporter NhaA [Solirubrobacteraceae bacterium]|nr:Na+/H+ antiporter NhaA [Solirubrobacteraceae bacterium]
MSAGASFEGRTAWARNAAAPVRSFLATETGGAMVVVGAVLAALVWANVAPHSYGSLWSTRLSIRVGGHGVSATLRNWIDQGLMTLFFLVVGLEAKRQLDLGELRDRQRIAVPALAALCGALVPSVIYLAWNAGGPGAHGWGAAISTDTALALSIVGLLAPRSATRIRVFLLSFAVVDDLLSLAVIAAVYTSRVSVFALVVAVVLFLGFLALRWLPVRRGPPAVMLGLGVWLAMFKSGVDPVISGLAIGLATSASPPSREQLSEVLALTRSFREQPTPELARAARRRLVSSISANDRVQYELHPWTSYVIVPLFALANAGVHFSSALFSAAAASPVTWGILSGYVVGKPVGVMVGSWIATRPALRGPRAPISPPVLLAGGATVGVGFTVSLLIAGLAFTGEPLAEAKLGTLATLLVAPALGWLVIRGISHLPADLRARQVARTAEDILDLAAEVDPARDHIRGDAAAPVTLVEYGDFECTYCGQAERSIRELLAADGADVRYVWRHLPLNDVHPDAQLAAEAAEAAGTQGRFWAMHDTLLAHQGALSLQDLADYGAQLGLNVDQMLEEIRRRSHVAHIEEDVASADESGVSGTPTFFINGRRHYGVYDLATLTDAVRAAKQRALQREAGRIPAPAGGPAS